MPREVEGGTARVRLRLSSGSIRRERPGDRGSASPAVADSSGPDLRRVRLDRQLTLEGLFLALAGAALSIGSLHTAAPDHWVPFAALARARGWSAGRTARVTLLCGFGHDTVSALVGLTGLRPGEARLESLGERMSAIARLLLFGFGVLYALWGFRRAF